MNIPRHEPLPIKGNRNFVKGKLKKHERRRATAKSKLTMTVAARTVGGQAQRPETTPANKE
jgi:hypothetical protein